MKSCPINQKEDITKCNYKKKPKFIPLLTFTIPKFQRKDEGETKEGRKRKIEKEGSKQEEKEVFKIYKPKCPPPLIKR